MTTRPGQVAAPSVVVPQEAVEPDLEGARAAVDGVRGELPYSDLVADCVVDKAAIDPELLADVEALVESADARGRVLGASASCSVLVEAGPRFAEGLQRTAGGALSDEQLGCAAAGYGALEPGEVAALSGAVLNLGEAGSEDLAVVEEILVGCGIDLESGN